MPRHTILVVDDETSQRETLAGYLKKRDYDILTASQGEEALDVIKNRTVDLLLTDMRMPAMDGTELLHLTKQVNPDVEVIVMTAFGSVEVAIEAMKNGAADFITKPVDLDQLELTVAKVLEHKQLISENQRLRELAGERYRFTGIISKSQEMELALNIASRVASSKTTVLITGESGTGKELIAQAIHFASPRRENSFVGVNMAALSDNLVESELFGHEKGAFTGADRVRKGRFELAHGGTLFIDEVGDIPLNTQVKLLRVLQEQQVERVGSAEPVDVDVRVIAATNRPLEQEIRSGTFREDLYYRLNVVRIDIPPLRKRRADIPLLVEFFRSRYAEINGKEVSGLSREAMDALMKYDYPGNVRELENIIEQGVVLCRRDTIHVADLPHTIMEKAEQTIDDFTDGTFQERVEAFERNLITDALGKSGGVQTRAAQLLGMTERHLRYKLQKYKLK
jgi:DNA-binding NtrC family response regulator